MSARDNTRAVRALEALRADLRVARGAAVRRGASRPSLALLGDTSVWALSLLRAGAALRAVTGSSLGTTAILRTVFHIDVWTDEIGGGLRLPHPFNIVIGGGASIGEDCVLMHNVTVQHGEGTRVGSGAVLGTGSVVLAGSQVGHGALVGAASVVRGEIPEGMVAVGAPARVVRPVHAEEVRS